MVQSTQTRSDALGYLYKRYYKDRPERIASLEKEMVNVEVAERVHDLRSQLGMSRDEFGSRVGVDASIIEDLEEADFDGEANSGDTIPISLPTPLNVLLPHLKTTTERPWRACVGEV